MIHFDTRDLDTTRESASQILRLQVSEDSAPDQIVIPDAQLLVSAKFKKVGSDLTLTGPDGKTVVIEGYYNLLKHPDLVAPGGGGLSADLVERLAVPETAGQYAQVGGAPAGAIAIGRVERLGGSATVQHANGTVSELQIGDTVYQGDIVETRDDSQLGVSFNDGTAFNLGTNARMVLSELVYTASGQTNSGVFNLVKGTMTFVAGQVAKSGDMKVVTPVSTMGIRGTTAQVTVSTDAFGNTLNVVYSLMADPDGHIGLFDVLDSAGNIIGTIRTTDSTFYVTPAGPGLSLMSQTLQKTPEIIQAELAVAQILFPIYLSNPANFVQTPQLQDLQPKSDPPPGSSQALTLPPQGTGDPVATTVISVTISGNVSNSPPAGSPPGTPPLDFIIPEQTIAVTIPDNLLPLINVDPSPHLVEASNGNPGVATAVSPVIKGDLDGTASYDTAGLIADKWDNLGNGIYGKLGSYGAAALNTVGVAAATLLASGWTDVGAGVFEKLVVLHDASGNAYNEIVRVNADANTLTYALDNTKADPLAGGAVAADQFLVRVIDDHGAKNQALATFTVDGTNDAPIGHSDTYATSLGQTLHVTSASGVLANDHDLDGTTLSAILQSMALHDGNAGKLALIGGESIELTGFNPGGWTNADGVGTGSTIQMFDTQSQPGQGLFLSGPSLVTFTFMGTEAGYFNAAYFDGQELFINQGAAVGSTVGGFTAEASLLEFLFKSITPGGFDALNGGQIDPNVLLGFALVGDNRAYAFFDDIASGDHDFDDMVVRIDVHPTVETSDGLLTFNADGSFDFKPFFAGIATFTYKVNDGTSDSASTATVTIDVPTSPETLDISASNANTQIVLSDTPGASFLNTVQSGQQTLVDGIKNVTGGLGNDSITGINSGGILNGGSGSDVIYGGNGNDILIGGSGNDQLTGNAGDDFFVFRSGFGRDAITDFNVGDVTHHDVLDLRGLGFTSIIDVLNHTDLGPDAVIHAGVDDITLASVTKAMLMANSAVIMV